MGGRLRDRLLAARDQGQRPTCLSFAVAAAHGLAVREGEFHALSEEMVHWGATRTGAHPAGATIEAVGTALKTFGQCLLDLWPYDEVQTSFGPPKGALDDGAKRRVQLELLTPDSATIKSFVRAEKPVILVIPVCVAFFRTKDGFIPTPEPDEVLADLHAVLVTDYIDLPQGISATEFRNSWGGDWGDEGYGYIAEDYIERYAVAAARLRSIAI